MGAPRYQQTGPQRSDNGPWVRIEEIRSALASPESFAALCGYLPRGKDGGYVYTDTMDGLRAAFDAAIEGPPNYLESDYEIVRDKVADRLNPPDEDAAECQIIADAVEHAFEYIEAQPCHCTEEMVADHDPCKRCRALGRLGDEPVAR